MAAKLIVALDVPSAADIAPLVDSLPDDVEWYKVGLELFISAGPDALTYLKKKQKRIFLDLKLHDIPRTVARAIATAHGLKVDMLTLHAGGGKDMLEAAAESARDLGDTAPALVAVTVLTSLNQDDLPALGIQREIREHTLGLGKLAVDAGIDGLVCSTLEAAPFRDLIGSDPILVTPGIRPAGADVGDQKRVATPQTAVEAGSSFLVVGRPIVQAPDPGQAAADILAQIADAQGN